MTIQKFTKCHKNISGFTLAELLIVVAIIAVLVAISIPIFNNELEKARESTDLANVRSAYAEIMADANNGKESSKKVMLKQTKDDWQLKDPISVGGVTHYKKEGDTEHWKGTPKKGGACMVSFSKKTGILFDWTGKEIENTETKLPKQWTNDVHAPLNNTNILKDYSWAANLEIDSACADSSMVPLIEENIKKDLNCILQTGTWAYMGSTKKGEDRYLFWTSIDINNENVGAGKQIPIIACTGDGRFYVSESVTATRKNRGKEYTVIINHVNNVSQYKTYIKDRTEYASLQEAYTAYEKLLSEQYPEYK